MRRRAAEAPSPGTDSTPVAVQTVAQRLSGVYGFPRPFLKSSPRMEIKHSLLLPLQRRGRRGHSSLPLSPLGCCCVCRQWKRLLGTAWRRSCLFPLKDRDVYSSSQASSWETLYSRAVGTAVFPFRKSGAHGLIPLSPSRVCLPVLINCSSSLFQRKQAPPIPTFVQFLAGMARTYIAGVILKGRRVLLPRKRGEEPVIFLAPFSSRAGLVALGQHGARTAFLRAGGIESLESTVK